MDGKEPISSSQNRLDNNGNFKKDKKRRIFKCRADINSEVLLAGDFNNWEPEPMKYNKKHALFSKSKELASGKYEYKFIVNGAWVLDEQNENFVNNDQGSLNSVLIVE